MFRLVPIVQFPFGNGGLKEQDEWVVVLDPESIEDFCVTWLQFYGLVRQQIISCLNSC